MTLEKAAFPLVCWGSDSEHRAGCEEVNYNPAHERGWEPGLRSPDRAAAAGPGRGSCRVHPMGARGDTWPPGAASPGALVLRITLIWPQIVPGSLGSSPCSGTGHAGDPRSPTAGDTGGLAVPPAELVGGSLKFGAPLGRGLRPAPADWRQGVTQQCPGVSQEHPGETEARGAVARPTAPGWEELPRSTTRLRPFLPWQ